MRARFRQLYGDRPLHLLALIACLLIAGAAIAGWFDSFPGPTTVKILEWFLAAIVAHDLVLLPLYSFLDRIALEGIGGERRTAAASSERVPGFVYLRVPALLSGLLGLVFLPEIVRLGDSTFFAASGFHQRVFLARYLLTCAALFALAGLAYAVSLGRAIQREDPEHVPGGGPAERDDEGQRRQPAGREPLARSTDSPGAAGQNREAEQEHR